MPSPFAAAGPAAPLTFTASFPARIRPADLPLAGVTILAVEDSRYASDALRLLCQRSGARLRRADTLAAAAAHLRVYRPDVVIVDRGLPDGDGLDLIRQLSAAGTPVLATSGDPAAEAAARAAGAAGFLEKPAPGLVAFQHAVLAVLTGHPMPASPDTGLLSPDPMALADDLRLAVRVLDQFPAGGQRSWLAGFLRGLARQAQDPTLARLSALLDDPRADVAPVSRHLADRLAQGLPLDPQARQRVSP
jgi:CheY-like chemotaxis protein